MVFVEEVFDPAPLVAVNFMSQLPDPSVTVGFCKVLKVTSVLFPSKFVTFHIHELGVPVEVSDNVNTKEADGPVGVRYLRIITPDPPTAPV
jgi:hypothetical protein